MNRDWSDLNKTVKLCLKSEETYLDAFVALYELRKQLMVSMMSLYNEFDRESFNSMPYMNSSGYHNKTMAYSIWHIFRIEDIVVHTLINCDEQIFFKDNYNKRIHSPIVTTGNELTRQEIADFSKHLDIEQLFLYSIDVKESTEKIIASLKYDDLKRRASRDSMESLKSMKVVSDSTSAKWLIDYWYSKDIRGLICMPLSRHWIMHTEAALRIAAGICRERIRK